MPIFKGEKIKFDVVPGELDFVVEHNSLVLKVIMFNIYIIVLTPLALHSLLFGL